MINIGEFNIELHNSIKNLGIRMDMYTKYLDDNDYNHYILIHDFNNGIPDIISCIVIKPTDMDDIDTSIKGVIKKLKKEIIKHYKSYPYKYNSKEMNIIRHWVSDEESREQKIHDIQEKISNAIFDELWRSEFI